MTQALSPDQVRHVAKLARLSLSESQIQNMAQQLSRVLTHIQQISELDLKDVQPMAHALDLSNQLRDDVPGPTLTVDQVLANAPDKMPPFFQVPKVIDEGSGA